MNWPWKKPKTMHLYCNSCGSVVSTEVPKDTVIRAWIECPECVDAESTTKVLLIQNFTVKELKKLWRR